MSSLGYDLAEVRRRALHREIRRRRTSGNGTSADGGTGGATRQQQRKRNPSSSGNESSATLRKQRAELHREMLSMIRTDDATPSTSATTTGPQGKKEKLGQQCLDTIHVQKQSIAELRPMRRKIKWNSTLSDWDRKQQQQNSNTRILTIQLDDLQIHGRQSQIQRQQQQDGSMHDAGSNAAAGLLSSPFQNGSDIFRNPGAHIEELECAIRRCFQSLNRVNKETSDLQQRCQQMDQENVQLQQQLQALNGSHRRQKSAQPQQSEKQIQANVERLKEKLAELDEQLGTVKMQKKTVDADCLILQEIVNESNNNTTQNDSHLWSPDTTATSATAASSRSSDILDEDLPLSSLAEDSDIKTFVTTDDRFALDNKDPDCYFSVLDSPTSFDRTQWSYSDQIGRFSNAQSENSTTLAHHIRRMPDE